MRLTSLTLAVIATLGVTLSNSANAEGFINSPVRVAIDRLGVPWVQKDDSFGLWREKELPHGQKAIAASGGYFHYHFGTSPDDKGYAFYEGATFAISENGNAFRYQNYDWQSVTGCWGATDVSSFTVDHVYCVNGDGSLKKFNDKSGSFEGYFRIDNEVITKIDVALGGVIWAITESDKLFKYDGVKWTQQKVACGNLCSLVDIAVGGGQVYVVASVYGSNDGPQSVYTLNNGELAKFGSFYNIDVDREGVIWAISNYTRTLFYKRPGMTQFVEDPQMSFKVSNNIGS
ncbi:hypothetical protein [Pseudoalteromonas luteoviolacea]|uniref:Uncharacterized protein n=1 Tax=Pseudoalteromonas luteoviolacea (strain 2ta16) TaxID=1353533 RepID=V4H6M1_PSEL2|nr:hypothetical protein [Pseudoalteromonas luteoviolacea]ESP93146.1 hypothetical protein PL2TA16_03367 [Pseudoalteromonas luteoviolacea 2ta16]KZN37019.1 hypothetical protein N483_21475 [Pseudoalteromonas luteoviolacea NCIMB 1944]